MTGFTTSVIDSYYGYTYNYSVVFASEMEEAYQGPDVSQLTTKAELDSAFAATDSALADSDFTISSTITADTDEPFLKPITSKYIQSQNMIYTSMNKGYWLDASGYCDLAYAKSAAGWLIASYPEDTDYEAVFSSTTVGTSALGSLSSLSSKLFTKSSEENGETYYSISDSRYFLNSNLYKCFTFLGSSYYSTFESNNMTDLTVGIKNGKVNDFSVTAYAYGIKYVIKYTIKSIGTTYLNNGIVSNIKSTSLFAKGTKWLTTGNFKCTLADGSYLTISDNIACVYDSTGVATQYLSFELPKSSTNTNKYVFSYTTADSGTTWTKKQVNYTIYSSLYAYLMNTLYGFPGIDKYNSTAYTVSSDLTTVTIGTNYTLTYNSDAQVTAMTIDAKSYAFSEYGTIAAITLPTVA